jgi:hypothetical protein
MRAIPLALVTLAACGIDVRGLPSSTDAGTNANDEARSPALTDGGAASSSGSIADGSLVADGSPPADAEPPYEPCPPSNDLLLCLPFDDSSVDRSPSALTVKATNLAFTSGKQGSAGRFALSPKTDVQVPAYQGFNTPIATVEFWLNPASFPSSGQMLVVDMDGRFGVYLNADGTVSCRTFQLVSKNTIGQWMHIACVNDGTKMYGYANGKLEASGANQLGTTANFIGIGQDSPSGDRSFEGLIDTLRVWKSARSAAEIADSAR